MNLITTAINKLTKRSTKDPVTDRISALENLFGTLAANEMFLSGSADFLPKDANGNIIRTGGENVDAQWTSLSTHQMQYWAYMFCSPLGAVIDRLAEADTNGRIKLLNADGTTNLTYNKTPSLFRIMKLFVKPNPLQVWEEFNAEQVILCKVFGYCPVWALDPTKLDKSYTKYQFNLNPLFFTPVVNTDFDIYSDDPILNDPIKEWTGTIYGKKVTIPSSEVFVIKDGYIGKKDIKTGLPVSKVEGLEYFISNICAAMEADNVLLKKKGPLGVFSHDPKPDMAGWIPLQNEEKLELQDDLKRYGLSLRQLQYVISKTPLKWNAMSFNLRDLMTKETVRQGIDGICDRFGYPAELMSGKNATYENRNSAEKFLYQNNVIPFTIRRMARYNEYFELDKVKLSLDYDHVAVLQEDIQKAGEASKAESEGLQIDWEAGMITFNEYRASKGRDTVSGMDIYYPEWYEKFGKKIDQAKNPKPVVTNNKTGKPQSNLTKAAA